MNKMKEVAELLGVQFGMKFKIKDFNGFYYFDERGLNDDCGNLCHRTLYGLLNGDCEIEKTFEKPLVLYAEEKKYLENVLRPFRGKDNFVRKIRWIDKEALLFKIDGYLIEFVPFEKGTMYKGMKLDKDYTLEELGLFEDEQVG